MTIKDLDLDDAFEEFMRQAYAHVQPHDPQYRESRRVFYAGVMTLFVYSIRITELSEVQAEQRLAGVQKQLETFFEQRVAQDKD